MQTRALVLSALAAAGSAAQGDGPAGTWVGHWEREGSALSVEMTFAASGDGYLGSFSSDQLRVVGIPLASVRRAGADLSWEIVGDETSSSFEGTLRGDRLTGRFREGPAAGTFTLRRAPHTPAPLEEEVTFASGAVSLAGTLVYPPGPGPFPGILFLHGSGAEGRWASRYLAHAFARAGVASLIYDKRGVGRSSGDWRAAGFEELVDDASAALQVLRSRPRVDAQRVGLHGHSQGGTLAPWVASRNAVAFVVASAAAGEPLANVETYSVLNFIGARDLAADERSLAEAYVGAIVDTAFHGAARAQLEAAWDRVRDRPWAFAPPAASDPYWAQSRLFSAYDPLVHWRAVDAPALLVYGLADERVPPRRSAARIAEAYLGTRGTRLDVALFADADHAYRLPRRTSAFEWPRTAPGYPERLIEWVQAVTRR